MRKFLAVILALAFSVGVFGLALAAEDRHTPRDAVARRAMVASAKREATLAGLEILRKGGNAVDAAVAVALALNVTEPNASGLGGGGFMLIRLKDGEVVAFDYRETAPASSTKDMFASDRAKQEKWSVLGGKAVAVPGLLAGLQAVLERYGTMTMAQVAEPAIRLAEEGFVVTQNLANIIKDNYEKLARYNDPAKLPFFKDGVPLAAGDRCVQPQLARALRLIAEKGADALYRGPIGQAIVEAVNRHGGSMTMEDLGRYQVKMRKPVEGTYRGYRIFSMAPPSSGGIAVIQILNVLENFPLSSWGFGTPRTIHHMAEAFRLAFADRARYMADPDFVKVPVEGLTSKAYAAERAKMIDPVSPRGEYPFGEPLKYQSSSTTHTSIVDQQGNMVAFTHTINYFFGSGIWEPTWGIVLNNEMDDFSPDPRSVNAPEPGKRPLSSMSPTLVLDPEGDPFMVVGTPGATRIITTIVQVISNVVDFGMGMDQAIEAPRFASFSSAGKPTPLFLEKRFPQSLVDLMKVRGYSVEVRGDYDPYFGAAQGVLFDKSRGLMFGGADSRRDGYAEGF